MRPATPRYASLCRLFFSPDGRHLALAASEWQYGPDERTAAAFSPDGRTLALGGGAVVFLWNVATGQQLTQIGPEHEMPGVARFSTKFTLWNVTSGSLLWSATSAVAGMYSQAVSLAFSPDGRVIVSGSAGGGMQSWDAANGAPIRNFTAPPDTGHNSTTLDRCGGILAHPGRVLAVAFSPDGRRLVSAGGDGSLRVWDPATGGLGRVILSPAGVQAVSFRPDGRMLVAAFSRDIALLEVPTGRVLKTLHGHDEDVQSLALTPDGATLWSGAADGTIKRWSLAHCVDTATYGHIQQTAVSADGTTLAFSRGDSDITVQRLSGSPSSHGMARTLRGFSRPALSGSFSNSRKTLALSPDGRALAGGEFTTEGFIDHSGVFRSTVLFWGGVGAEPTHRWEDEPAADLAFSPDGRWLVDVTADLTDSPSSLRVRALPGGRLIRTWRPDATGAAPFGIRQRETELGGAAFVFGPLGRLWVVTTGPDGPRTVVGIWDVATGRLVRSLDWVQPDQGVTGTPNSEALGGGYAAGGAMPTVFDADPGGRVVAGLGPTRMALWNDRTGRQQWLSPLVPNPRRSEGSIETDVAVSPDGRWVASGGIGMLALTPVIVRDGATGLIVARLDGEPRGLTWLSFSRDGRRLFAGFEDGTMRIWGLSE